MKPPPNAKKTKLYNSRTIRTESADPALKEGKLDVPAFVASREYEIRAFEQLQLNTKYALATRVFQSLPRTLRRRTASHNVKRVPRRLRARALREMQNTTTGVPPKKPHLRGRALHRLKVEKKLLRLAAKIKEFRAVPATGSSAVADKFAALNSQLDSLTKNRGRAPLNNRVGACDRWAAGRLAEKHPGGMKYAHRQREFAWLPTHIWHAKRFHMVKRHGYQLPLLPNQKCFRATSRAAKDACVVADTSYYGSLVARCDSPARVLQLLRHTTRYVDAVPPWLAQGDRAYNGWLYAGGARLAPGSLVVSGSSVLVRVHPSSYAAVFDAVLAWSKGTPVEVGDCRYALGSILLRGPTALHALAKVFHIDAPEAAQTTWRTYAQNKDPQLVPAGTTFAFFVKDPRFWKRPVAPPQVKGDLQSLVLGRESAVDRAAVAALLHTDGRVESYRDMYSVQQLGKEFARRSPLSPNVHGPSRVPVVLYKTASGSWCVSLPWFWVQPLWTKLIHVTGVKTGGVRQDHQLNFENSIPTYPLDYPFMPEGHRDNELVRHTLEAARKKLPASKQAPMKAEGPLLMGCDWYFLRKWIFGLKWLDSKDADHKRTTKKEFAEFDEEGKRIVDTEDDLAIVIAQGREHDTRVPLQLYSKLDAMHQKFVAGEYVPNISEFPQLPVVQVELQLVGKGSIRDNARIYKKVEKPSLVDLVGFVTTGAFNFNHGLPTGIGLVSAASMDAEKVYVRNMGSTSFWPAHIKKIK